jgi:hypothetical protein
MRKLGLHSLAELIRFALGHEIMSFTKEARGCAFLRPS